MPRVRACSLFILLPILGTAAPKKPDPLSILAPTIREVVVYPDQAEILSEGKLKAKKGSTVFIVPGISEKLQENSFRINLLNGDATLADVKIATDYATKYLDERRRKIDKKIQSVEGDNIRLRKKLETLLVQYQSLIDVSVTPPKGALGQQQWPLRTQQWPNLIRFMDRNLTKILREREKLHTSMRKKDEELKKLRAQQAELVGKRVTSEKAIALILDSEKVQTIDYELRYVVTGASWYPLYDLRVKSQEKEATLVASAWITQQTGADWENVDITVSSAVPNFAMDLPQWKSRVISEKAPAKKAASKAKGLLSRVRKNMNLSTSSMKQSGSRADRPQLEAEALLDEATTEFRSSEPATMPAPRLNQPYRRQGRIAAKKDREKNVQTTWWFADKFSDFSLKQKARPRLTDAQIKIDRYPPQDSAGGFDYRFKALRKESIKSSQRGARVPIKQIQMPIELFRRVHPSVSKHAFIEGKIRNTGKVPLLRGTVNLYLDDTYVGREQLPTLSKGSYGRIALGVDRQIEVQRVHKSKREKKGIILKDHETTHDVAIQLTNLRSQPIAFLVEERLPRAQDPKRIKLKFLSSKPNPKQFEKVKKGKKTQLRWRFDLPAKEKKSVSYQYMVSHRANLYVNHEAIP